jgi:hypothetical protein
MGSSKITIDSPSCARACRMVTLTTLLSAVEEELDEEERDEE